MQNAIRNIGVIVKPNKDEAWQTAFELAEWLAGHDISLTARAASKHETNHLSVPESVNFADDAEWNENLDLVIVLGGDGTIISTARLLNNENVPILGINYGSLGYLTEFRIEELKQAVEAFLAGNYRIDARVMLEVELYRAGKKIESGRVLNEVAVNRAVLAKIIEVEITLDGLFVNLFRADGVIIATPTGSTAYSLSAGGPIVYPSMNAVVITPICPFTLTNRPIVIPDNAEIKMRLKGNSGGVALTFDGQVSFQMQTDDVAVIRKSKYGLHLIQPPNRNYFDVLRNKLKWGR